MKNKATDEKDKKHDQEQQEEVVSKKEFDALKELAEQFENKYKRALADYHNLEKRVQEERRQLILSANKQLLLRILPVLDTLMLASTHSEDQTLKVTLQQFLDVLKSEGVTKIETKDKDFDPRTMECVATEQGEEGKVLEELRPGYMLGEQILRPGQVKVGQRPFKVTNRPMPGNED